MEQSLQDWANGGGCAVVQLKCNMCNKEKRNIVVLTIGETEWIVCVPCHRKMGLDVGRLKIIDGKTGLPTGKYL